MSEPLRPEEPNLSPEGYELNLVSMTRELGRKVDNFALQVNKLRERMHTTERLTRQHRILLIMTILGLCLDLALSGLFIAQRLQQDNLNQVQQCSGNRNAQFFAAEHDKVAGQVKGLKLMLTQPRAGFNQFTRASEHYLYTIDHLEKKFQCAGAEIIK